LLCQLTALLLQLGVRKEGAHEEGMEHFTQELPLYSIHMSFEIDFKVQNEASFWYPMFILFSLYHILQAGTSNTIFKSSNVKREQAMV